MQYCKFFESLFDNGRVSVPDPTHLAPEEAYAADELIAEFERQYRLEMPGEPPNFCPSAASWAALNFYRACQFAVFRDLDEQTMDRSLGQPFADPVSPEVCYSVDVVFRYLPSLAKFASSIAERDPLLEHLLRWSREWPLSSVGMPDVGDVSIHSFADNTSLLQLYVDRIIAADDYSRLSDPRVREAVGAAIGIFGDLNSGISKALENYESEEEVG